MTICIHNRQRAVAIHTMRVKKRVLQIMAYLGCPDQELSVVFGNDRLLQELNRIYRHKDRPTNVLAFPQSPTYAGEPASTMLGDVIVSLPTAASERRYGHAQSHTHFSPHVFCDLSLSQHHADDGAISAPEGQSWRCAALLSHGRFLRAVP